MVGVTINLTFNKRKISWQMFFVKQYSQQDDGGNAVFHSIKRAGLTIVTLEIVQWYHIKEDNVNDSYQINICGNYQRKKTTEMVFFYHSLTRVTASTRKTHFPPALKRVNSDTVTWQDMSPPHNWDDNNAVFPTVRIEKTSPVEIWYSRLI